MAFKMKGFSGFKQTSYSGFSDVSKSVADAGDISKDPTTEGTLDLSGQTTTTDKDGKEVTTQGSQNILKEGQHKADRVSNFGSSIQRLSKIAGEKHKENKAIKAIGESTDSPAEPDATQDKVKTDPDTGSEDAAENKVQISDKNKKQMGDWASGIIDGFGSA